MNYTEEDLLKIMVKPPGWVAVRDLPDEAVLLDPQYFFNLQPSDLALEWCEEGLLVISGALLINNPGHEFEETWILGRGGRLYPYDEE